MGEGGGPASSLLLTVVIVHYYYDMGHTLLCVLQAILYICVVAASVLLKLQTGAEYSKCWSIQSVFVTYFTLHLLFKIIPQGIEMRFRKSKEKYLGDFKVKLNFRVKYLINSDSGWRLLSFRRIIFVIKSWRMSVPRNLCCKVFKWCISCIFGYRLLIICAPWRTSF